MRGCRLFMIHVLDCFERSKLDIVADGVRVVGFFG